MTREEAKAYNAENYPASVLTWLNEATDRAFDDLEKEKKDIYRQGVIDGFKSSGEGYNWEYPFRDGWAQDNNFKELIDEICNKWEQKQ